MISSAYKQIEQRNSYSCSCSYRDTSIAVYVEKAMDHPFKPLTLKRSHGDVIPLWIHSDEYANNYLEYLNSTDASGKIRFTVETENQYSV